jgi:hypothetical protein
LKFPPYISFKKLHQTLDTITFMWGDGNSFMNYSNELFQVEQYKILIQSYKFYIFI